MLVSHKLGIHSLTFFLGMKKKIRKNETVFCSEESTIQNTIKIALPLPLPLPLSLSLSLSLQKVGYL